MLEVSEELRVSELSVLLCLNRKPLKIVLFLNCSCIICEDFNFECLLQVYSDFRHERRVSGPSGKSQPPSPKVLYVLHTGEGHICKGQKK